MGALGAEVEGRWVAQPASKARQTLPINRFRVMGGLCVKPLDTATAGNTDHHVLPRVRPASRGIFLRIALRMGKPGAAGEVPLRPSCMAAPYQIIALSE